MDTVFQCCGVAVVGALLAMTTKKHSGEFGALASLVVVLILLTAALGVIKPVLGFMERIGRQAELGEGLISPVLRTLAIGFLTETGKTLCEEAGEKSLGQTLSLVGGGASILVLLPLMEQVLTLLEQML